MARKGILLRVLEHDTGGKVFLTVLAAAVVAVAVLNLAVPTGSPLHVPTFVVTLLGKYLCYALLAIALDLVWGYCGILSLGHAAFFALGGYAMGMYLMRQIGDRGVYGNAELPDFMVFLNWKELPWYWYGFDQFWFAMLMGVVVPVRDAEDRARFLGYRVESFKLWIFVFSAMLAGIAGALYVPQVGIINPGEFSPLNSIELVVWVAVGGRGTLYGAAAGALLVNFAKTYLTGALPEVWLFALGALFVVVTLFLPQGLIGWLRRRSARLRSGEVPQ